jgi:tripartite-type tricarboxylate transporter receptor subunit TctC
MWKNGKVMAVVLLLTLLGLIQPALGKDYPAGPIEIVCPYTAGGPTDIIARLIGDTASKYLGQPVVVVNKPGAGGALAALDVIKSKPDGYKIANLTNMFFATTVKTQKIPFDPTYLVPIANFMEYRLGLIVRNEAPWTTLNDLLSYGKNNPGKLRWSHTGRGTIMHMQGLLVFRKAGIEAIDVPYPGNPESVIALLGGHVDATVMSYGTVQDQVKAGKIRYLTFFSTRRYSEQPNVPTSVELGFTEPAKLTAAVGLYVHKDTPEPIKKILIDAFKKTYENPEFRKGLANFGEEPRYGGPEFITDAIKKGEEVGVPIIKELGLYVGK